MTFRKKFGIAAAAVIGLVAISTPSLRAAEGRPRSRPADRQDWSFAGMFGTFDQAQLKRGFQVYKEVCSALPRAAHPDAHPCQPGGPGFTADEVKTLAATYTVHDGPNMQGEMFDRPGRPADFFPSPFANPEAAAAALGAAPPDMSLLAKSIKYERGFPKFVFDPLPIPGIGTYQEVGPDLIYAILNGYSHDDDPNWNLYFPGHKIAMPKPLSDGQVQYKDGSPATVQQYSKDVAAFLYWAAEPNMEYRKLIGRRVLVFLLVFAVLLYFTKKRIWADVAH